MSTKIERKLSVGINVKSAKDLPEAGRHLARFLKSVDHEHGPFDVNIAVSVAPTELSAIGPVELPADEPPVIEIVYKDGPDDYETEGAD